MRIYTYLNGAPLLTLGPWLRAWERSWRRNGWTPVVLMRRAAERHSQFNPSIPENHKWWALAMQRQPGYFSSVFTFNRAYPPPATSPDCSFPSLGTARGMSQASLNTRALPYGVPGWQEAELISFDGFPVDELYDSGLLL
jgi:hypothetical protein